MTEIYLRKGAQALVPEDDHSAEVLSKIKPGQVVRANIKRSRNPQHHKLFFAMLGKVQPNTEYATVDDLLDVVKLGCRHFDVVILPTGS